MKLVNPRSGEFRTVSGAGAFFGSLFLGPVYLLFKGVWTWGLLALVINLLLFAIFPPFTFLSWLVWAGAAGAIVENFYNQRGFESTGETNNRPKSVEGYYTMPRGNRWFFLLLICLLAACTFFTSRIFMRPAQAQEQPTTAPTVETETYGVRSEKTGELKQVIVRRHYPPQPPPQTNIYVLPPPVYYYGGRGYRRY